MKFKNRYSYLEQYLQNSIQRGKSTITVKYLAACIHGQSKLKGKRFNMKYYHQAYVYKVFFFNFSSCKIYKLESSPISDFNAWV